MELKVNLIELDKRKNKVTMTIEEFKKLEKLASESLKMEDKLRKIWREINNAHYFSDMKSRNFYNLIHEIANIIKPGYEEIGKEYIE